MAKAAPWDNIDAHARKRRYRDWESKPNENADTQLVAMCQR